MRWDAEEVGYSYTSDSLFVATRIKDSFEKSLCAESEDTEDVLACAEYQRHSKVYYYPDNVDKLSINLSADAEALDFCSESRAEDPCPYEYSTRALAGRLVAGDGAEVASFGAGDLRQLPVSTYLQAAATTLEDDTLRWVVPNVVQLQQPTLPSTLFLKSLSCNSCHVFEKLIILETKEVSS